MTKKDKILVTEDDIIETYPEKYQKQVYLYKKVMKARKKLKEEGKPYGWRALRKKFKTSVQNWLYHNGKPYAIKSIERLKKLNLLPLTLDNSKLGWIAGICGFVFGDGHLAKTLLETQFSGSLKDLQQINTEIEKNLGKKGTITRINGTRYMRGEEINNSRNHSVLVLSYTPFARLLYALGTPKGNKTKVKFSFPGWLWLNKEILRQFIRGLLWAECSIPKTDSRKNRKTFRNIDFKMSKHKYVDSHIKFLNSFKRAIEEFGVRCAEVGELGGKRRKNRYGFKLKTGKMNILKMIEEFPPLYIKEKESIVYKEAKKAKESLEKRNETYRKFKEVLHLKKKLEEEHRKERRKEVERALELEKKGLSQREIARKLGVSQAQIWKWVNRDWTVPPVTFREISKRSGINFGKIHYWFNHYHRKGEEPDKFNIPDLKH